MTKAEASPKERHEILINLVVGKSDDKEKPIVFYDCKGPEYYDEQMDTLYYRWEPRS